MADRVEFIISAKDLYSKTLGGLTKMLPSLKTTALAASAAVAGLGTALFAMTKSTATAFDAVQKFSDQLGLSTEFLSSMQHAADLSGVQINTMNKSIQMLQVRIGEANRGIGQGKDAFEALGVTLRDSTGQLKNAENILPELADAFKNMASETERAEAASKIFGQRGIAMLQIFKDGSAGLAEMTAEAEKFGLVVDAQAGAAAAEFNDSLTRLQASIRGLKNTIGVELMGVFTTNANALAEFIANNRQQITDMALDFIKIMGNMGESSIVAVGYIVDSFRYMEMMFRGFIVSMADLLADFLEYFDKTIGIERYIELFRKFTPVLGVAGIALKELTDGMDVNRQSIDAGTEGLRELASANYEAYTSLENTKSAVESINEYMQIFKNTIDDVKNKTYESFDLGGIPPFTEQNLEKAREVRKNFEDMYTGSQNMLYDLGLQEFEQFSEDVDKVQKTKMQGMAATAQQTHQLTTAFGKKFFGIQKATGIANATISAYEAFNTNLKAWPMPFGGIMAALALATGLAQVAKIAAMQPTGAAHGGLTNVPREQTFLLDKGERVLSPEQNKDLTEFLKTQASAPANIELTINTAQPLDLVDWDALVEDDILPALTKLNQAGIKI